MKTGEKKQHWAKKKEEKKIIVPKFRNFFRLATVSHILTFIFGAVLIYSLFFESMKIVTGPSFSNSTFMSAPKIPFCTG